MNKATFTGKILDISSEKTFVKKGKNYTYKTVLVDTGNGNIAANYWSADPLPPTGSDVTIVIKLNSERNPKNPEVFFHKVNLHSIHESPTFSEKIQH
jgi:hypothetical protein